MTFGKTALRCWLPVAALLLALLCPLPVAAARVSTAIPVSVRTDGAAADAVYTVELTPLDAAPAPVQRALTVKNGGTVYFTGFAFDEPGDYRYLVAERSGGVENRIHDFRIGFDKIAPYLALAVLAIFAIAVFVSVKLAG